MLTLLCFSGAGFCLYQLQKSMRFDQQQKLLKAFQEARLAFKTSQDLVWSQDKEIKLLRARLQNIKAVQGFQITTVERD